MELKSSNKVETNRYELEIEIDGKTFDEAINKAYHKQVGRINIQGFRKGKAPRAIIEKMYGQDVFYEDAMQDIYPEALEEAAKEAGLTVINDKIDLDVIDVSKDGFTFKAVVTVTPEVEIEDYKGIAITKKSAEVTDEILNEEIEKVRQRNSRIVTVPDRAAQLEDTVVIDFEGFVDGEAFEGGKAENYNLKLGSGSFIPGFEEQLVGHKAEEEFSINVNFPEDYQAEDLQGKESEFKIKIHEIKTTELPEFDDEFVKDVSDKETVDEYKEVLKEEAAKRLEHEAEHDIENQLVEKLIELLQAEIPEAMYKNTANGMLREFDMNLRQQGMDLNTYMQYTGMDAEAMVQNYMPQAEQRVKLRLALEKIAEKENIVPNEENIEEEYKKISESYGTPLEKVKEMIPAEDLSKDVAVDMAMKLVRENAKIS